MEVKKLFVIFTVLHISNAAKILFFRGFSGYSHRITVWPLVEKLASNGHQVTFFSPHPPKWNTTHPNITEMVPKYLFRRMNMDFDPAEMRLKGGIQTIQDYWFQYFEFGAKLCESIVSDPELLNWAKTASYDLVVVNALFNDCGFALAYKFKAPTIVFSSSTFYMWWNEAYGIPDENFPEFHLHHPMNMTFLQQVRNVLNPLYWSWYRHWYYLPRLENMVRPALDIPEMPGISELDQTTNLIIMNTHYSEEYARSLPPSMIQVGGMHCNDNRKPLPKDIEAFVNKWEKGFVLLSLGTYLRLPLLPQSHQDAIINAIRKFPDVGFILKWNGGPVPQNLPENIHTAEWLAQQDILAHPKIKAFITHGGFLSTQEAVYHAVPVIVFPIFADQDYNAQRIHDNKRGIKLEIMDLTEDTLVDALRDILSNKKYKDNILQTSKAFRDRPMRPVDTAVWWVDYVLRHKNTTFLHAIGIKRTWYERRMLHIWGFLVLLNGTLIFITFKIVKFLTLPTVGL